MNHYAKHLNDYCCRPLLKVRSFSNINKTLDFTENSTSSVTDLRCNDLGDPAELDRLHTAAPSHMAPPVHQLPGVAVVEAGAEGVEGLPGVRVLDGQCEHLGAGAAVTGLVVDVALGGAAEELVSADH